MKHYHYEIQGFNNKSPYPEGQIHPNIAKKEYQMGDVTLIEVLANNEQEALLKAEQLCKKKFYRTGKVYECHQSEYDSQEEKELKILALEQQNKLIKSLTK